MKSEKQENGVKNMTANSVVEATKDNSNQTERNDSDKQLDTRVTNVAKLSPKAESAKEKQEPQSVNNPGSGKVAVHSAVKSSESQLAVRKTIASAKSRQAHSVSDKTLPRTGEKETVLGVIGAGMVTLLSAIGLVGKRKKGKNREE